VCPVEGDMTEEIQTVKKKLYMSKVSQLGLRSISPL
jgi:hypothetical protein